MANNSKVVFGNETLIDLTGDTAEPGDVLLGKSFHRNSGAPATGTLDPVKKPDVAVIEPSSTASAPHLKDTYLYYDGTLYKATDDIAQGDTIITSGASANVEEVTVGGELNALNNSLAQLNDSGNWRTGLRFKNLGTSFTAAQATALANGDFSDFWNGDYWVIGGHNWRIVDNSGWANRKGDKDKDTTGSGLNFGFNDPCLIIMPDDNLVAAETYLIDDANETGHGYSNCAYRTRTDGKGKAQCKTIISNAFGSSHIATHRELISTSRGTGGALGWGWQDADVELPSEVNICGHPVWGCGLDSSAYGASFNVGDRWGRFMLFRLAPYMAINRSQNYWLRDIHSASHFAYVGRVGDLSDGTPSLTALGLRPFFILK